MDEDFENDAIEYDISYPHPQGYTNLKSSLRNSPFSQSLANQSAQDFKDDDRDDDDDMEEDDGDEDETENDDNENTQKSNAMKTDDELEWLPIRKKLKRLIYKFAAPKHPVRNSPHSHQFINEGYGDDEEWLERRNDGDDDNNHTFNDDDNDYKEKSHAMETEDELEWHSEKNKLKSLISTYEFEAQEPTQSTAAPKPSFGVRSSFIDHWTDKETLILLDVWGNQFILNERKSLRFKEWKQVAEKVSEVSNFEKTVTQCRNRVDTLKKKYKKDKIKFEETGSVDGKCVYFKKMDKLMSTVSTPPQQAGLSCGLDSGLRVPLKPRNYVNRANQLDDMKNSPRNTEVISAEGLEGPRSLDSRLCASLKPRDYVNRVNQLDDMKNSLRNTESIDAKGLEGPRGLDSRLCVPLKLSDYVNRANQLDDMKNSPQTTKSIGAKGLEGPCDLDSGLCASLKPRDYVNRANRLDDMKNSPGNSDSIGTKGLEGPRGKKISKVKGSTDEPSSFKLLADSILKLGIIYEKMENKKWQRVVELEKLKMDFLNDMETRRRQNFQRLINEILKLVQQMDDKSEDSAKNDDNNLEGLQNEILKLEQRDDKNDDSAKSGM